MLTDLERADVYERAAEHIEEHGWTTGALRRQTGEVCVSGAIAMMINPAIADEVFGDTYTDDEHCNWMRATALLAEFIEPFFDSRAGWTRDGDYTRNPISWNNRHAKDKYEVIELLRRAAKELRNGL